MLTLRLARAADAPPIAELSRDIIEQGLGWTWHRGRVLGCMKARATNVLVAVDGSRVIGFAIMEYGTTRAHLSLLGVHPAYQRRGIARSLLAWLEKTALVAGLTTIELELRESNHSARRFYHQLGYADSGYMPGYYRGVETALLMTRTLSRPAPGGE